MAAAETAKLLVSLSLKDDFSKGVKSATTSLGKLDTSLGKIGKMGQQGLGNAARNLAKIGAVAAVGVGAMVKSGIDSLAELESAVSSVDGAITQMGIAGEVTGSQIAGWANEIEAAVGAAFDDKAITQATATLIRFGKVTPKNIRPAMEVMTDLAAKTGSVDSAATLLAKALADPTKAAGKLARQGIVLTKAQQDTIKAMVEANDVAGAQDYILTELAKTTKGAAAASQGPYKRAMSVLADVTEDAQRALAEGFLPVLMRASDLLGKALADPKVINNIREFGKTLAGGLDSLIGIAKNLPWQQIGDSLKLAGAGAKAVLGAFNAMPPWVQTAILTGWGLNKLSGGMLGGIVGELGKGLIKGVLNTNAGVVNIKAAVVNGLGGGIGGGAAGGAVGGAGILGKVGSAAAVLGTVFIAGASIVALAQQFQTFVAGVETAQTGLQGTVDASKGQNLKQTLDNLNGSVAGLKGMNTLDKRIAATFGGGQLTDNFVSAAGRVLAEAKTNAELVAGQAAIKGALEMAKQLNLGEAVGPLTTALSAIELKLDASNQTNAAGDERIAGRIESLTTNQTTGFNSVSTGLAGLKGETADVGARTVGATEAARVQAESAYGNMNSNLSAINATTGFNLGQVKTGVTGVAGRIATLASSTATNLAGVKGAVNSTAGAIRNKKWQFQTNVTVQNNVSVRAVTNGQTTVARYTGGRQTSVTAI